MGNIVMSIVGGQAMQYIDKKRPSELIPFKGEFPIVPESKQADYFALVRDKMFLEDCPEWAQKATLRGKRIYDIEKSFRKYLTENNIPIDDFLQKNSADKSTELIRFFNANSLSLDSLKV